MQWGCGGRTQAFRFQISIYHSSMKLMDVTVQASIGANMWVVSGYPQPKRFVPYLVVAGSVGQRSDHPCFFHWGKHKRRKGITNTV